MTLLASIWVEGAAGAVGGAVLCYLFIAWKESLKRRLQSSAAESVVDKARRDAENVIRDARLIANEEALKIRAQTEEAFADRRQKSAEREQRLGERESLLNHQLEKIVQAEKVLQEQKATLQQQVESLVGRERELGALSQQRREQLQTMSRLTEAEARAQFLQVIEHEAAKDAGNLSRHMLEEARARAEEKARHIVSVAIQRYAGEHTFETTTSTIALNGDDMKGRIIGRDGGNIRAFEAVTGVTVLIDDTPNAVVLSGFDPVRREIASQAMSRLILDGRIHPTRIEEIVTRVQQEMEETILRLGGEAVQRAGLPPMHGEITKLLGRLHFRRSYSQNVLDHSVEVAHLTGMLAAELGLDIHTAKRAGLLHDIGKAISHEVEGPHAIVGADFIKRHGEGEAVVNGVASHHNEVQPVGPWGILVSAADAISASRPGARSENMTTYLKRVDDLEKIALAFPGVERCFAVQAGRELRVLVSPEKITDELAYSLARNIALEIENALQYPGQIKVTVIREIRCVEVAK